jgi:2-dehydro-3-deoxyphosphogluconate aldolase/(4S)-4-hydroxy-2-oxoglutarate aldolase
MCRRYSVPVMPGAMTPTEIVRAWQAGADFVKVFPSTAAGPGLIRDLRGPLPQIKMIPTGGINLNNAAEFIKAGAAALGVGSALVTKEAVKNKDFAGLKAAAAQWLQCVRQAREATK